MPVKIAVGAYPSPLHHLLAWSALDWLHEARFDPGQEHPIFDWCDVPHFTAANQFDAPRAGAVFKRGRQGQGFYRDARSATISVSSPESLDRFILEIHPSLMRHFIGKWGVRHRDHCHLEDKDKCNGVAIDGHMKCTRPVCANEASCVIDRGKLGLTRG